MNTNTHEIFNRPYTIREILLTACEKMMENFRVIVTLSLMINFPIRLFMRYGFDHDQIALFILGVLIILLIPMLALSAIAFITCAAFEDKQLSLEQALQQALQQWPMLALATLMFAVFFTGLTVLLVIPGIIFAIYCTFFVFGVLLHNQRPYESLFYSKSIVQGRWWRTFGYMLAFSILQFVVGMVSQLPVWVLAFLPVPTVVLAVLHDLIWTVIMPFFTVVYVIFYLNFNATKVQSA